MKRLGFLFLSLFSIGLVFAAPSISGIDGEVSYGESIVVHGIEFGNSGPNVVIFDDFEKGVDGQTISMSSDGAAYGGWDASGYSDYTRYSSSYPHSGGLSFRADSTDNDVWYAYLESRFPSQTTDVFASWWLYLPSDNNYPGHPDRVNWKQMWLQGSSTTDDDLVLPVALGNTYNDIDNWVIGGNERNPAYMNYVTGTIDFRKGEWKRIWVWVHGDSSNGDVEISAMSEVSGLRSDNEYDVATLKSGGYFERIRPNGYADPSPNCYPNFDDIYVASGANARARVEIGNAPVYEDNTNLAVLVPVSWSDDNVEVEVYPGSFDSGDDVYLYVVDGDGEVSEGYPITISESYVSEPGCGVEVCDNGVDDDCDGLVDEGCDSEGSEGVGYGVVEDTSLTGNDDDYYNMDILTTYTYPDDVAANSILLRIDLDDFEFDGVESVELGLYLTEAGGDESYDVGVYRVEGVDVDFVSADSVSYGSGDWSEVLGMGDVGEVIDVEDVSSELGWKFWDVSEDVLGYEGGDYVLLLSSDDVASMNSYRYFASLENSDESLRPYLRVVYGDGVEGDVDGDGVVSFSEVEAFISLWLSGDVLIGDLLEVVNGWKGYS